MRFFVSSTYEDLKKIRGVAINMLKDITGAKTASISAMESFPASPSSSSAFCLNQLDGADIMIGIYGFRFGSKGEDGRSLTEIEFDEAVKNGTKILAFVADGAEYTQDTDQQHFLQTKVSSLGGVWARFDPNNLGTFATVLNESLKNYLNGYEGYSYHSIWDDIIELKHEISKDDGIPRLIPYGENEEEKALDDIIESAGKRKSTSVTKGNPYIKSMLCEIAWVIAGKRNTYLSAWYWRIKQKKGAKKAIVALARKLLVIIYTMLKQGTLFDESCFETRRKHCEQKQLSRYIRELEKHGYHVEAQS